MNKPWDNDRTPIVDSTSILGTHVYRNLERRMRAAERLLARCREVFADPVMFVMPEVDAHLEAAQKEDGQ